MAAIRSHVTNSPTILVNYYVISYSRGRLRFQRGRADGAQYDGYLSKEDASGMMTSCQSLVELGVNQSSINVFASKLKLNHANYSCSTDARGFTPKLSPPSAS